MKKLLAFMLVFAMIFALAACGDDSGNESSNVSSTASQTSTANTSKDESKEQSKEESKEQSKEQSKEESEEQSKEESSTEPEPKLPEYIDAFVNLGGTDNGMKATDSDSIRLTKIDEAPEAGDVVCFTPMFGETIEVEGETYADYAILVVEYNAEKYQYLKKAVYNLDDTADKSKIAIPSDGFVVAIHKDQEKPLKALAKVKDDGEIYPAAFQPYDFSYEVKKTETPFEIDGKIGDEWKDYLVDSIDETNPSWDYSQFDLQNDSPITADYYLAYDAKGVYIGLVVNADACKWMPALDSKDPSKNKDMYKYTCIQVNTLDQSPLSDYMIEHAMGGVDPKSHEEDHLRQLGFSGSDDGNSFYTIWMGGTHEKEIKEGSKYSAIYDEANETITYEVYLTYEEMNIDPTEVKEGFEFSISVSINSTTQDNTWKNIRARNGGGIIGMNEFTKMPVCVMSK